MSSEPAGAPPPYSRIDPKTTGGSHLQVPRNDIPPSARRSMEDEGRELPQGWIRQYDAKSHHQFFVDTRSTPPRSIWHHPYDDEQFLETLPSAERERIQEITTHSSVHDIMAESSDDEAHHPTTSKKSDGSGSSGKTAELPPRPDGGSSSSSATGKKSFTRKLKDKVTGSTHEEREAARQRRAEEERRAYELHLAFRRALVKSMETGQPEFVGKDRNGKDVFVEPPPRGMGMGGGGYPGGYGPMGYGVNPYGPGMYGRPDATYIRPQMPYGRPYGMGYGGGYGLPLAGGLMGGLLLGGALGGF